MLRRFNKEFYGNLSTKVKKVRAKLADAQLLVLRAPCEDAIGLEKLLKEELQDLLLA